MNAPSLLTLMTSLLLATASLTGCGDDTDRLNGRTRPPGSAAGGEDDADGTGENGPIECSVKPTGRNYVGFDGASLTTSRVNENIGINRARLKPFRTLEGEYKRVVGAAPASLASQAGSFDSQAPRWFEEPQATGVGLSALYSMSFEAALAYAKSNAKLAAAPTAESASTECAAFMRKAWSRTASPDEIAECAAFATEGVGKEADPARKWAYAFASVLSSTRFVTY